MPFIAFLICFFLLLLVCQYPVLLLIPVGFIVWVVIVEYFKANSTGGANKAKPQQPSGSIHYTQANVTGGSQPKPRPATPSAPLPPLTGGVYLLKAGPHYKIGKATEFDQRIKQLKIQLPFAVEVVHKIYARSPSAAETFWHRRFARKRVNGEWFTLSDEDVAEFKSTSRM